MTTTTTQFRIQERTELAALSAISTRCSSNAMCYLPAWSTGRIAHDFDQILKNKKYPKTLFCGVSPDAPQMTLPGDFLRGSIEEIVAETNKRGITVAVCCSFYQLTDFTPELFQKFDGSKLIVISDSMYMVDYYDESTFAPFGWLQTECEMLDSTEKYDSIYVSTYCRMKNNGKVHHGLWTPEPESEPAQEPVVNNHGHTPETIPDMK